MTRMLAFFPPSFPCGRLSSVPATATMEAPSDSMKNTSNTDVGSQTDPALDYRRTQEKSSGGRNVQNDVGSSHLPRCMSAAMADINHDYYKDTADDIKDGAKTDVPLDQDRVTGIEDILNRYIGIEEARLSAQKTMAGAYSDL